MSVAEALERLAALATPGPWEHREKARGHGIFGENGGSFVAPVGAESPFDKDAIVRCYTMDGLDERQANAALIVALRNNLPTIIEALKALERVDGEGGV